MKIGILTYHRAQNYGAVLQAYALRTYLLNEGHTVELIDYWPRYFAKKYSIFYNYRGTFRGLLMVIFENIIAISSVLKRRNGFFKFIREYLNVSNSRKFHTGKDLNEKFDVVVYGSDQIWRKQNHQLCKGFDYVYFTENSLISSKQITYAASMGEMDLSIYEKEHLIKLLKNYSTILVREQNLNDLIVSMGFSSSVVLDPVFLLNVQDWKKIIPGKENEPKYILLYHKGSCEDAIILVEMLRKKYNYDVKIVSFGISHFGVKTNDYQTASPLEFLSLFYNAEFVVCTSFHGVAFSLIFSKQFYALGLGSNCERVMTLLRLLNIPERYLESLSEINFSDQIDYSSVAKELEKLVSYSKIKLLKAINS